jgi:ferredoxin-NADP reductase
MNLLLHDCEADRTVESISVSLPDLSIKIIRCGTLSRFSQRTMDPVLTVRVGGSNAKFLIAIVFADTEPWLIGVGTGVTGS